MGINARQAGQAGQAGEAHGSGDARERPNTQLSGITELGATPEMIEGIADATLVMDGGYKVLTREEIVKILRESL